MLVEQELTISLYAGMLQDVVNYPYPTTDIGLQFNWPHNIAGHSHMHACMLLPR